MTHDPMYSINFKDGHRIIVKVMPDAEKPKSHLARANRVFMKKQILIKKPKSA